MPAFDYQAIDLKGKKKKGSLTAESEKHARRLLKEQGLFAETINPVGSSKQQSDKSLKSQPRRGSRRVNNFQLAMVLRQIGVLIRSGLPLDAALKMTVEQAESERERRMGEAWRAEISEGRSFSSAIQRSPYLIPENVIASIAVGEETGHLHEILIRLADELEVGAENQQTFTRALIYPVTLMIASAVVVGFMMVYVVPNITSVFLSTNVELPLITRFVVAISNLLSEYWVVIIALLALVIAAFQFALRKPSFKQAWHKRLLAAPGIGKWMLMADTADWSRSLGILLKSGVPALSALNIAATVVKNVELRRKFEQVTETMRRGSSLRNSLSEADAGTGFLVHMVGSGEASSELSEMLLRVAEYYRLRLESSVDTFLKIINPVLIVFIGIEVLVIVLAVMLPIIEINNLV